MMVYPCKEKCPEFMLVVYLKIQMDYLQSPEFLPRQIIMRLRYTLCIGKANEGGVEGTW